MERDMCSCYIARQGLYLRAFYKLEKTQYQQAEASDLYLREFCTLECLLLHFLWFLLGARTYRIQECHPGQAPEFRPQCFFLRITWDWTSKIRLMCWFEVNLTYFEQRRSLGPEVSWATGTVLSSLSPGHMASLIYSIRSWQGQQQAPFTLCPSPPLPCPGCNLDQLPCSFHRLYHVRQISGAGCAYLLRGISRMLLLDVHQPFWSRSLLPMVDVLILSWVSLRLC